MDDLRTRLTRLSRNLWWSWHHELALIFRAIDLNLWRQVNHNPIAFLQEVDDKILAEKEVDASILTQTTYAENRLRSYLESKQHWAAWNAPGLATSPVAYFSAEFCIHESIAMYSGGLGVLAGDHLKSCSDLGIPAYGVSLLYRQGYFTQYIDAQGLQIERYQDLDTSQVPIEPVRDDRGEILTVSVDIGEGSVTLEVWQAMVGRCPLLLLDFRECRPKDCFPNPLRLYGGDRLARIAHEIALGVGGYRALGAMGVSPGVIHMNEGHSAFVAFEAIAERMEKTGLGFDEVAPEIVESIVFTTHTPVEAGHDRFDPVMVLRLLKPLQKRLQLSDDELLAFGRVDPKDPKEGFCMSVLALKLSHRANGVSALHGMVSRKMWQKIWPERAAADIPIGHITNGVHTDTWISLEWVQFYRDWLGSDWRNHLCDPLRWRLLEQLDPLQLWSVKVALKRRLLHFLQRRQEVRWKRLGLTEPMPEFSLDALTIGFARRFASYKRALLLFQDMKRLEELLTDPERPVQVIFAGKAHPADEPGKAIIRRIVEISKQPRFRNHIVFVEDHDKNVSRHVIEGCDLWLNTPRRPLEACGTSGMKAVFNATLNCSVMDGWWHEAYNTRNGFAFGDGLVHVDPEVQDRRDAESLMTVLKGEVVPLFYDRNPDGIPVRWIERVKDAFSTLAWRYNSDRMVMDYVLGLYLEASKTLTAAIRH